MDILYIMKLNVDNCGSYRVLYFMFFSLLKSTMNLAFNSFFLLLNIFVSYYYSSNNKGQLYSPHSCHWFYWVGFSRRVFSLGPHCSMSIHLSAAVAAPGAYDLGSHLVVQAKHLNELEFVPQSWRSDAVLIVT